MNLQGFVAFRMVEKQLKRVDKHQLNADSKNAPIIRLGREATETPRVPEDIINNKNQGLRARGDKTWSYNRGLPPTFMMIIGKLKILSKMMRDN